MRSPRNMGANLLRVDSKHSRSDVLKAAAIIDQHSSIQFASQSQIDLYCRGVLSFTLRIARNAKKVFC